MISSNLRIHGVLRVAALSVASLPFFIAPNAVARSLICEPSANDGGLLKAAQLLSESIEPLQTSAADFDSSGCESKTLQAQARADFDRLVKDDRAKGMRVIQDRKDPDERTSISATYRFNAQKLKPGDAIYLWVPSDLSRQSVNFVILGHRQNPATEKGTEPGSNHDQIPGLTSVQIYDRNRSESERWRYWGGSASGSGGAKFAERQYEMEMENLYSWAKLGHISSSTGRKEHDELKASAVRLMNVGTDDVELGELTLKVNPPDGVTSETAVFTPNTTFGSAKSNGAGYQLGGGQNNKGLWPNAIALAPYGDIKTQTKLPKGWKYEKGRLLIPLPKGKTLTGLELAAGDSHPDGIRNDDGGWGTKGWSKLSIEILKDGKSIDTLMSRENVPPEGFLTAAPTTCHRVIGEGEYLVLRADADTTYLAGIKLNFGASQ